MEESPERPVRVARTRSRREGPRIVVPVLLLVALAFAAFVWRMLDDRSRGRGIEYGARTAQIMRLEKLVDEGLYERATEELARIDVTTLSEWQTEQLAPLREAILAAPQRSASHETNAAGSRYLHIRLRRYEENRLSGNAGTPEVRVLLERCAEFRERWPHHAEGIAWVEERERRHAGAVDLDDPPTWPEASFAVDLLVEGFSRDHREALRRLDAFAAEASPEDAERAARRRAAVVAERAEYHASRMEQARFEYEAGRTGDAIMWLVEGATRRGDAAMEREAAEVLVAIPGAEGYLRGYHRDRPDEYALLLANPVVEGFARGNDLPAAD
jgi:hypothetical protein